MEGILNILFSFMLTMKTLYKCNRSPPPGSAGILPAGMAVKMTAFPGKEKGG